MPISMTFDEYSVGAARTEGFPEEVAVAYLVMGLAGEAGELCNKYKKVLRDDDGQLTETKIKQMQDELGDVLWYLDRLADRLGTSLRVVAEKNLNKLASRAERGVIAGSGDNR